jgi:hypothetical protein
LGRKIRPNSNVVFTDLDDGTGVLLHLDNKFYYSLNESGCFMWQLIEGEKELTEEKLVDELYAAFDVEKDAASADVKEFVDDLVKEGLVEID